MVFLFVRTLQFIWNRRRSSQLLVAVWKKNGCATLLRALSIVIHMTTIQTSTSKPSAMNLNLRLFFTLLSPQCFIQTTTSHWAHPLRGHATPATSSHFVTPLGFKWCHTFQTASRLSALMTTQTTCCTSPVKRSLSLKSLCCISEKSCRAKDPSWQFSQKLCSTFDVKKPNRTELKVFFAPKRSWKNFYHLQSNKYAMIPSQQNRAPAAGLEFLSYSTKS